MKTARTPIGICRYPSGIQPWNGKSGILIRKARANARKTHAWVPLASGKSARSLSRKLGAPPSAARTPVTIAPTSISSEPTSV